MPWPKCGRFSISVTRRSGLSDFKRCAARTTPLAPPPTITIEFGTVEFARPVMRAPIVSGAVGSGSGLDFQCGRKVVVAGDIAHLGEAALIQHLGDRLPDLEHQMSDLACRLVAVFTALIPGAAGAGNGGKRPVEHAHDVADLDFIRRPRQAIAALLALAALDKTG